MLCFEKPENMNLREVKMAVKEKKDKTEAQIDKQNALPPEEENASNENFPSELRESIWSVVSFEKCEASGLTYAEAEQKIKELETRNVSGLCIVTDEAADRIPVRN